MRHGFAKAYAKLNLTLDVLGRREDGYHDLEMVMQSVSLYDSVSVRIGTGDGITTVSNVRHIPNDERNIACKAAKAFLAATGIDCGGIHIAMEKRIPSSAGMAGGSADGAAVLRLLSNLTGANLTDGELCEIGITVGADIPFCLMGGTALACAKGEELRDLRLIPECFFVIGKPKRGMSTKVVFEKIDSEPILHHPDTAAMLRAIEGSSLLGIASEVYNVFEAPVSSEVPEVSDIKSVLLEKGAITAAMTGSGSSVFGIFDNLRDAEVAKATLSGKYSDVFIASPVSSEDVKKVIICE